MNNTVTTIGYTGPVNTPRETIPLQTSDMGNMGKKTVSVLAH